MATINQIKNPDNWEENKMAEMDGFEVFDPDMNRFHCEHLKGAV